MLDSRKATSCSATESDMFCHTVHLLESPLFFNTHTAAPTYQPCMKVSAATCQSAPPELSTRCDR